MKEKSTKNPSEDSHSGVGLAIGLAIGTALGVALGNIAVGIAVGVGVGAAIGTSLDGQHRQRKEKSAGEKPV